MQRAAWAWWVLAPALVFAAPKEKLALMPVQAPAELREQATAMEELIAADVARVNRFDVLTSSDVATMISVDRQRELAGCTERTECLKEIASALGTGKMLVATLGKLSGDLVVGIKVIDFDTGKVLKREVEQVPEGSSVSQACDRLVAVVLDLPPPSKPSKAPRAGWFVLGGAGVLALGGVGVGLAAQSDANSFKTQPNNDALANQALTKSYAADGLYAGAAVTAVVAAVMLLVSKGEP
ncbi:MAG: hypothetical protein QM723_27100 [Myxococcaceae bacterium]